jgi:hypothetical protein
MPKHKAPERVDLGHDHFLTYFRWAPDDLPANRERYGIPLPRVEKAGAQIYHPNLKQPGTECASGINFDIPEMQGIFEGRTMWQVQSWDPLTINPSLLCLTCGDHGFIREGKWVPA